VNQLVNRILW